MENAVCTGDSHHGSCELSVFTVLVRKSCGIKNASDLFIIFSVIAPLKPGFSSLNVESQILKKLLKKENVCSNVVATTLTKRKTVSGGQSSFSVYFWMKENKKRGMNLWRR